MIEVELKIPANASSEIVIEVVEETCIENNLTCALKGTLASYPGCVHWHYRTDKQKGTLEITWWEVENRLWFKVAKGRKGEWMDETLTKLKEQMEVSLK